MNIYAYTELHQTLPAFVSLNVEPGEDATLSVRSRMSGVVTSCPLSDEELARMADNILVYLAKKQAAQS